MTPVLGLPKVLFLYKSISSGSLTYVSENLFQSMFLSTGSTASLLGWVQKSITSPEFGD